MPVAWWYARRHALAGWPTADVLAPGVVIGQAIGRLGCFAAGCCYGRPAERALGGDLHRRLREPPRGHARWTSPLHPTQLYESLACFLIFFVLLWLAPRKRFHGQVVLAYVALYAVARFVLEFFRGDAARGGVFGGSPPRSSSRW